MKVKYISSKKRIFKSKLPLVIGYFGSVHIMHHQILDHYFDFNILTFRDFEGKSENQIYSFEERIKALKKYGPENIYVYDIKRDNITANQFIEKVLKKIQPSEILIGSDFVFGSDQQSWRLFRKDFKVNIMTYNPEISTSSISKMLRNGNVDGANNFLYEPYHYSSLWIKGSQRGRQLGYRTINLKVTPDLKVAEGVYITRTTIRKKEYKSITFVGASKTFGLNKPSVETHIIGKKITKGISIVPPKVKITFISYLRDSRKFASKQALVEQIQKDIEAANKFFSTNI